MSVLSKCFQVAAMLLIIGSASSDAWANVIYTDTFPSASSTRFTQLGSRFWNAGDFVEQQFTNTGITEINEFSLDLGIGPNSLNGDTQDMDVLINGVVIGSYQINPGDTLLNLSFTGLNLVGTGDYLVRLLTTRTVIAFAGSAGILDGTADNLVLTQLTTVAVPEPGALGLLAVGLFGLGFAARRRHR